MHLEVAVVAVRLSGKQRSSSARSAVACRDAIVASASATTVASPSASPNSRYSMPSDSSRESRSMRLTLLSSRVRSRITACARAGSFQNAGSSALAFSSARRARAAS